MVVRLIIFCFAGLVAGCAGMGTAANTAEPDYPEDKRDTLIFKSPVRVDEFVLKFVKP